MIRGRRGCEYFIANDVMNKLSGLLDSTYPIVRAWRKPFSSTPGTQLLDNHGRLHDYLRISLTERCNLRCRYCMPAEGIHLTPGKECLDLEELKRITDLFVIDCGIKKIRLTGGEPTVDRRLTPIVEHLNTLRASGLKTIAMTTNGLTLKRRAKDYRRLGLDAINVSLDTLKADRFEFLTRKKGWNQVYQGMIAACEAEFKRVKLNCVVMKDFNDDECVEFVELARQLPIEVRFIEFMPFAGNKWSMNRFVPYKEMLDKICEKYPDLEPMRGNQPGDIAKVYRTQNMLGSIGFISSMSDHFCSGCNRLRVTADGHLKVCLFGHEETSLKGLIRNGASDEEIVKSISCALGHKRSRHAGMSEIMRNPDRPMIKIGAESVRHSMPEEGDPDGGFTHIDAEGKARMVDIGSKGVLRRVAVAEGKIRVGQQVLRRLQTQGIQKGNIISVAKVAGIMAAKSTSRLIPMCHQVPLDHVEVNIEVCAESTCLIVTATASAQHKTGVEMESLTAVTVSLLTIYDMCKSIEKSMLIFDVKLISKVKE